MKTETRKLREGVRDGSVSVDEALAALKAAPFEDIGFAKVDLHRKLRQGAAEVIYGAGKTPAQIAAIMGVMKKNGQGRILITRLSPEAAEAVSKLRADGRVPGARRYRRHSRRDRRHERYPRCRGGRADGGSPREQGRSPFRRGSSRAAQAAFTQG